MLTAVKFSAGLGDFAAVFAEEIREHRKCCYFSAACSLLSVAHTPVLFAKRRLLGHVARNG
jgi:hypothetical protein